MHQVQVYEIVILEIQQTIFILDLDKEKEKSLGSSETSNEYERR